MSTATARPGLSTRRSSTLSYSSPALASTPPSTTPLHRKVTRLLSANFEDAGTRAALDTLGQLERAEPADHQTDDKATKVQVGAAQQAKGIRGALKRGGLRKEVDGKMAEGSREFLDAFSEVNDKLSMLQSHLDAMHVCCDEVQTELERANQGTRYLLEHAEGLRQQRATTTVQQSLVHVFLARFTLTDAELRALTSREVPVGPELFAAMDKTERIRADCRALLSGEAGEGTQAGVDIMEYTAQHLEAGYAKLHKWLTFEARGFAKDVLEVSATVREAVSRLKSRPEQLSEVLSILGTTRSTSILNLFLDALTRGGPNGLPRPIELHAHDPIRYIGDMLAWLHQAMAGEREFLESLFGTRGEDEVGARRVGEVHALSRHRRVRTGLEGVEGVVTDRDRVKKLLDRDLEGCGRPLKIRVQQTIKSQESPIMAYQIATLIHFYKVTMERTVGEDALMSAVLGEIMDHAYEVFFETLKAQGRSLLRFIQPPAAALSAPTQLREVLSTLREIMTVYATSLLETEASAPSPSAREAEFRSVLDAALDPALDMCARMAEMRGAEWDRSVFWVNVDEAVLASLDGFGFVQGRRELIEGDEREHVEKLTAKHHEHLLAECGLEPILTALRTKGQPLTPLSTLPAGSVSSLLSFQQTFSSFLSTLDPLTSPRLSLLPPHLASAIHAEALSRLSGAYAELWDAVMDPEEGYEGRETLLRRRKEEVEMLLVAR
ncbi:oligomeric Golgi complex subunit 6 [Rhodotorula diobovata]|uniref:Conserved oligomeric Golgi complex subunit 6 n=1 Tax=Rhodotorula diobovata TaxID=5288 RepID=A0A5C5G0Q9_9BASI|nr:oligomeric Golgi complex subunit 6 [Rhodotorula diobovata]